MDALASEAFLNARHRVYGLTMRPLSLGHAFVLESIGNPFYHGQLGTLAELRLAAWICSRDPMELPNMSSFSCFFWRLATAWKNFDAEVSRWRVYVDDYCAPPQLWSKTPKPGEDKREPSRIPSSISTCVRLMKLGMSEEKAWATPVGAAAWYEAVAYENETGANLDIVTDSERLAILRAKLRQAAEQEKESANV